eukprot:PhF_6_TR3741/c0_g1_i2/m.5390
MTTQNPKIVISASSPTASQSKTKTGQTIDKGENEDDDDNPLLHSNEKHRDENDDENGEGGEEEIVYDEAAMAVLLSPRELKALRKRRMTPMFIYEHLHVRRSPVVSISNTFTRATVTAS